MDWIQIISAVGIGALLTKVLDITWLQRAVRESEKRKWLREKRLMVYSQLSKEILSMGRNMNARADAFSGYALAAEALLLVDNENLADDIEKFFTNIATLYAEVNKSDEDSTKKPRNELEGAYEHIFENSRKLVQELRRSLHEKT